MAEMWVPQSAAISSGVCGARRGEGNGRRGSGGECHSRAGAGRPGLESPSRLMQGGACGGTEPRPPQGPMTAQAGGSPAFGGFPVLFLNVQGLPFILIPKSNWNSRFFFFFLPYFRI